MKHLIILFLLGSSLLLAALPNIGSVRKEIKVPLEISKKKNKPLIKLGVEKKYRAILKDDKSAKKVLIKDFKIIGNHSITSKNLLKILLPYKNKHLSFFEINNLALLISKEYKNQGYFVARAYLPTQNLNNSSLEIIVIEGEYGEFRVKNKSKTNTSFIKSILNHKKEGKVISSKSLENSILLINDIPGTRVSSMNIKAGKKVGTSDFILDIEQSKIYDGYVLLDNYGGLYTGRNKLSIGANFYTPFNYADKISIIGLTSNNNDLNNAVLNYSFPLYKNGLRAELSLGRTTYHLSKEYENLNARGLSNSIKISLQYPILKQKLQNLTLDLILENNNLRDEINASDYESKKVSDVIRVKLNYDKKHSFFDLNHNFSSNIILSLGNLKFKDAEQKLMDKEGVNTQGKYSKLEIELNSTLDFTPTLSLETALKYQHSLKGKNLDGSEDFSIGGAYGVKVYPSGELSAENGYVFKLEAKYVLNRTNTYKNTLGVFYDRGKAYMTDPLSSFKSRTLQDLGFSYYLNYKDFFAKAQIAFTIDDEIISSEIQKNSKILFMAGCTF